MPKITINRFNGGMVNDPRLQSDNSCMVATGFDLLAYPHKLKQSYGTENGDSGASTSQKQNFCIALGSSSTWRLFGLGVVSGTGRAEVNFKNLSTGGSTDLSDSGWATPSNNASSTGSTSFDLFVYYPETGLIYGARSGTHIWAFDPTGSAAWADSHQALTYTTIAQGIVHAKDKVLYIPYDNKIASNNAGSWTTAALTLPSDMYITSICEYDNYLAIACAPKANAGNSRLYLWDRNTSLTTVSESIDAGQGELRIIEQVDGMLVGISKIGGIGGGSSSLKDRIIFRYLTGNKFVWFNELLMGGTSTQLPKARQKINGKLYFLLKGTINGADREGIFSIGRKSLGSQFVIQHEIKPENDTATSSGSLKNFFIIDDYAFISYTSSGTYYLQKTNDGTTYATSIYETLINPGMQSGDRENPKKMLGVRVSHEPLTSGQTVVLKYRVDSANTGNWVTVLTSSTVGDTKLSTNLPSAGSEFTDGLNYEFRLEATNGAQITGFSYKYENINDLI